MATVSRLVLAVVWLPVALACSSTGPTDEGGPPLTGPQAFIVSSQVVTATGDTQGLPGLSSFTLFLDLDQSAGTALAGWAGGGVKRTFTRTANGFRLTEPLRIPLSQCSGGYTTYDELVFTFAVGGGLDGTGQGEVKFVTGGDIGHTAAVTVATTAIADTEAPTFSFTATADVSDPLHNFMVTASEPLTTSARARLVAADGEEIPLEQSSSSNFVNGFLGPYRMLRYAEAYRLVVDGADFAGNRASEVTFRTLVLPPLVAEDGFESLTGSIEGMEMAKVLTSRSGPPISGDQSLYVAPVPFGPPAPTQLALRLAVAPGDTVVRFSYRSVDSGQYGDPSRYLVSTMGGTVNDRTLAGATEPTTVATIVDYGADRSVTLGPTTTAEIPLPADATTEVVFARVTGYAGGGCGYDFYPPTPGIIIDDLRVE